MEDKFFKQLPFIAFILILSVILVFSLYDNIQRGAEKRLEAKYQEGIEAGRSEIYKEIAEDIGTWKGYRLPVKIQDGTNTIDTFMILIPPSQCQQFLNQ